MALRVRRGKTNKQPLTTAMRSSEVFASRPFLVGALLTAVVLAIFAVKSLSSDAVTVPTLKKHTIATRALATPPVSTPTGGTPALIHVPAGNRLVVVDVGLAPVGRGARTTGDATAYRGRVSTVRSGRTKLSFTVKAGLSSAKIKRLTVRLPSGLAFSHSSQRLESGIVVTAGGKRQKLTAKINHGKLTITLRTPASTVHVKIRTPAITASKALVHRVKRRGIRTLYTPITTTSTNHHTTRINLKQRAR